MNMLQKMFKKADIPNMLDTPSVIAEDEPKLEPSYTRWDVEYTDMFGREANYSWVTRKTFDLPYHATPRSIVIRAKKELGLTGVKCDMAEFGETIELRPRGSCTVIFITPRF